MSLGYVQNVELMMQIIDSINKFMCLVFRRAHLRNVSGLPPVLRRQSVRHLREDTERPRGVAETSGPRCQGHHQETARTRQD